MTDMELYRPPRAELAVPVASDTDSWTVVLSEVATLASQIANTPFVPDGLRGSAPAVAAAILSGRELGLGPMTSLANIHVIKGKPALSAALMRALILAQGHQIETVDISDTRAVVRGRRRGEAEWEEAAFTADQAKRAGIQLGGYPQDKLYARATSRLARRKFADVIAGMPYSAEELEDGTEGEAAAVPAGDAEQPKPRTAQRKPRTQSPPPAQAVASPAVSAVRPPSSADAGGALPPLPGEEDAPGPVTTPGDGPGAPAAVTPKQLTAIWTVLSEVFLFGKDERDEARKVCAHIVNRELASSTHLTKQEAATVLDTLAHWEAQAQREDEKPRAYLQMMTDAAGGEPDE